MADVADAAASTCPRAPSSSAAQYERLERATAELQAPFALVDLDALWANAAEMERRAAGTPIRLASKSVRCLELQRRALAREGFRGTLAFTLPEALWLDSNGVEDVVVAYPTADAEALRTLAQRSAASAPVRSQPPAASAPAPSQRPADSAPRPRQHPAESTPAPSVMVDGREQLELIERAAAAAGPDAGVVRVCIDVDAGWRALGGRVRVGVKRSPVHTPEQARELARAIVAREGLALVGIMMYEAQIAGLGDDPPGQPLQARVIRAIQARSARELRQRRAAVVDAVQAVLADAGCPPLELVNGGGTGSLAATAAEPAVTEVTAGSGLYGPTLFDVYRSFTPGPAAMFALPVVRRPARGIVTALGGGYPASGPADRARLPRPHLPAGLRLDGREGAGEVQTPLLGAAADQLAVGERVYMRHAKAGELCERFASLYLLEGDTIVEQAPTYRGEGKCFL